LPVPCPPVAPFGRPPAQRAADQGAADPAELQAGVELAALPVPALQQGIELLDRDTMILGPAGLTEIGPHLRYALRIPEVAARAGLVPGLLTLGIDHQEGVAEVPDQPAVHVGPRADATDLVVRVHWSPPCASGDVRPRRAVLVEAQDVALGVGARPGVVEEVLVQPVEPRQAVPAEVARLQLHELLVGVDEQEFLAVDAERRHRAFSRPVVELELRPVVAAVVIAATTAAGRLGRRRLRRRAAPARLAWLGLVERLRQRRRPLGHHLGELGLVRLAAAVRHAPSRAAGRRRSPRPRRG
jgi:hypothetical protein